MLLSIKATVRDAFWRNEATMVVATKLHSYKHPTFFICGGDNNSQFCRVATKLLSIRCRHMTHKQLTIVLSLGLVATFAVAARGQIPSNPPQPQASAPSKDLPKTYLPGLGEFMGRIQTDHAKLWLAGEARNWELAEYQLDELKELFSDVQDLVPRYRNIPVGDMIDAIITGTVTDLENAIAAQDFGKFSAAFDHLTTACNSCHQAANRGFIAIRRPTQSNFSNQDFSPAKR
jgi:hypothetical protein